MKWVGGAPLSTASKVFSCLLVAIFLLFFFAAEWAKPLAGVTVLLIPPVWIATLISGWLDRRRYRRRLTQRFESFHARHVAEQADVAQEPARPPGSYERFVKVSDFILTRICVWLWFIGLAIIAVMAFSGVGKEWLGLAATVLLVLVVGSWLGFNGIGLVWTALRRENRQGVRHGGLLRRTIWLTFLATGAAFIGLLIYLLISLSK